MSLLSQTERCFFSCNCPPTFSVPKPAVKLHTSRSAVQSVSDRKPLTEPAIKCQSLSCDKFNYLLRLSGRVPAAIYTFFNFCYQFADFSEGVWRLFWVGTLAWGSQDRPWCFEWNSSQKPGHNGMKQDTPFLSHPFANYIPGQGENKRQFKNTNSQNSVYVLLGPQSAKTNGLI